jgi:predicted aldo/keto reductase-like oxidoreductase
VKASHVLLGSTGIAVSRLCFGNLQLRLTDTEPAAGAALFVQAVGMGVNFFDTAQSYGTQLHLGEALKRLPRDAMVISTRANQKTREEMEKAFQDSLAQLGTDYIDAYGMHGIADAADWQVKQPAWEYVLERKAAGQVRATIVTTHSCAVAAQMAGDPDVDVVLAIHNMTGFGLVNETLEDAERAAKAVHAAGKAFIAMKPLAAGGYIDRVDDAFHFYVERPYVTCVAVGMQSIAEVEMNIYLIAGLPVPADVRQRVAGQTRRLIIREWCQGCGQCVDVCPQGAMVLEEKDGARRPAVDDALCLRCGYCSLRCPTTAAKVISVASLFS